MTFGTMFTIQAAVTIVTAGIAAYLFGIPLSPLIWSIVIIFICFLILFIGRYPLLDKLIKFIIILLSISTIVAVFAAINHGNAMPKQFQPKRYLRILSWVGIIFLSGFSLLFITWRFGEGILF
jgi:Mn2+/Fe2+ NRAMP family transporter